MHENIYLNGTYLKNNPKWGTKEAPWKARQILNMLNKNNISPKTICEIGCGTGEILRQLQKNMDGHCIFVGYEISPDAFDVCRQKANKSLSFKLKDFRQDKNVFFDLILLIDFIEHIDDYLSFLKYLKQKGNFKIFHIPLDLSVQSILRVKPIMKTRRKAGHVHHFTKELALQSLKDVDYTIIDWVYTKYSTDFPSKGIKFLLNVVRKLLFNLHADFAVRILGGYALLVLTK